MDDQTLDERIHAKVGEMLSALSKRLSELEDRVRELDGRHSSHGGDGDETQTTDDGPPEATQLPA